MWACVFSRLSWRSTDTCWNPASCWQWLWGECSFNQSPASSALHLLWPSELTATETTPSAWPFNWCRSFSELSSRTSHTLTRSSRPPVTIKSFGFGSFLSKSNGFSSSGGVFSSPAFAGSGSRPQAHAQSAFSWAFSSLCSNENCKWAQFKKNLVTYIHSKYVLKNNYHFLFLLKILLAKTIHDSLKLSFLWTSSHATQQKQMFLTAGP